jgi:hypothetical protein
MTSIADGLLVGIAGATIQAGKGNPLLQTSSIVGNDPLEKLVFGERNHDAMRTSPPLLGLLATRKVRNQSRPEEVGCQTKTVLAWINPTPEHILAAKTGLG